MKKAILVLLALTSLQAQTVRKVRKVELYVGGGISAPYSPTSFSTYWNAGFNVHGGLGYTLNTRMSLILTGDYSSHAINTASVSSGSPMIVLDGLLNLKIQLNPTSAKRTFYPYAIFGAGAANVNFGNFGSVPGVEENVASISAGAGADFKMNPTTYIFVEGAYFMAFTSNTSTVPLLGRAGLKFRL